MAPQVSLPCEFVATLNALKLPHSLVPANMDTQLFYRFECLPADVAEVGPPLLVPAGDVPQQWPLFCETLLTKLTAERPLPSVCPVVLVQTRLCPEGLATEMALERLLASVRAQVHVEVGFLCEGVVAELTHVGPLIPVLGLDVHLEAIAARGPVPTLLTHKQLLSTVLEGLVQAQLCPGQKALGAG